MTNHEDESVECPECGETELELCTDEPGEFACTSCGLVFDKNEENSPDDNMSEGTSDRGIRISTERPKELGTVENQPTSEEHSSSDLRATRMEVSLYTAINRLDSGQFEVDEEQMEQLEELLAENGFYIASDSYDATLLTTAFVTTEEKMKKIDQIVETLKDWYTPRKVNYNDSARPQQHNTSEIFDSVVSVSVEDQDE